MMLSIIGWLAILGVLGTLGCAIINPKVGERFTEFYTLWPDGKAEGYSKELLVGEEARITVEGLISSIPDGAGDIHGLEFLLHKNVKTEPCIE